MKWIARLLLVLACLGAAACGQQEMIDRFTPKAEAAVAKAALDNLRHGNVDAVMAQLQPKLKDDPQVTAKLHELAGYFPTGEPRSVTQIGANFVTVSGERRVALSYEYQFDKAWVVAQVTMLNQGDGIQISGIHVYRNQQSLAETNAFGLKDKDWMHWLMLAYACVVPLFCLFAFVVCLHTPMRGPKWPWAIATLVSAASLQMVWSTGGLTANPLSVQFLGAGIMRLGMGPWVLTVGFPIGAVVFLCKRRSLMRAQAAAMPPTLPRQDGNSTHT